MIGGCGRISPLRYGCGFGLSVSPRWLGLEFMSVKRKQHERDCDIFVNASLAYRLSITSTLLSSRFVNLILDLEPFRGIHKLIYNSTTIQRPAYLMSVVQRNNYRSRIKNQHIRRPLHNLGSIYKRFSNMFSYTELGYPVHAILQTNIQDSINLLLVFTKAKPQQQQPQV
jgi:hypothetical protein